MLAELNPVIEPSFRQFLRESTWSRKARVLSKLSPDLMEKILHLTPGSFTPRCTRGPFWGFGYNRVLDKPLTSSAKMPCEIEGHHVRAHLRELVFCTTLSSSNNPTTNSGNRFFVPT